MKRAERAEAIKRSALALGFDLVGITTAQSPQHSEQFRQWLAKGFHGEMGYMAKNAEKRIAPSEVLSDARSIIVVGLNYCNDEPIPACVAVATSAGRRPGPSKGGELKSVIPSTGGERGVGSEGRIAQYASGERDYHEVIGEKLKQLSDFIRALPVSITQALGHAGTQVVWYVDTGPILERDLAQRAGIGFIGKHTNLINRRLGNWIFLGAVLTNLELPSDDPEREYCGTCHRCIDACPTRAIVAPYQLDARLCISYLTIELKGSIPVELRPLIGDHVFGCDDCLDVCPWNRFAKLSPVREFQRRELPPLVEFLSWDESKFRDFFRSTPIYRIKRRGFLRNVCVVLGNIGDESVLPALEGACQDTELLVREHAAWAVDQVRRRRYNPEPRKA